MGIPEARAKTSLRISFSRLNTPEEALAAADAVKKAVEKLRRVQGPGVGPVVVYPPDRTDPGAQPPCGVDRIAETQQPSQGFLDVRLDAAFAGGFELFGESRRVFWIS